MLPPVIFLFLHETRSAYIPVSYCSSVTKPGIKAAMSGLWLRETHLGYDQGPTFREFAVEGYLSLFFRMRSSQSKTCASTKGANLSLLKAFCRNKKRFGHDGNQIDSGVNNV